MTSFFYSSTLFLLLLMSFDGALSAPAKNGEGSSSQNQGANQNGQDTSHIDRARTSSRALAHATNRAHADPDTINPFQRHAYNQALPHMTRVVTRNVDEALAIEAQRAKERQDHQGGSSRN